jgi:TRAP-type uncharacterized transport system substrate-binding protein
MGSVKEDVKEHIVASHEFLRDRWSHYVQILKEIWPLILLLIFVAGVAIWFAKPAPPNHVFIATGAKGGATQVYAKQYAKFFKRHGITLESLLTHGSNENIARLLDRKDPVQVAFVQGGLLKTEQAEELLSLGSIGYEPLWFFHRVSLGRNIQAEEALRLQKIAIGPPGSGTNTLAQNILRLNGVPVGSNVLQVPWPDAVTAIQRGDIDGIIIVDSLEAPIIQILLRDPNLTLVSFERVQAYTKQLPYIEAVQLPMGSIDLAKNMPSRDVQLLATTVSLLIDKELHPAIQMLFMQVMTEVNGRESFFSNTREFPAYKDPTVQESEVALQYYKNGSPWMMRYLPFWLAEFIERMFIMLMPLIAFAYPIITSMPNFRRQQILKRLQQQYGKLKFLESDIVNHYEASRRAEYIDRLNKLEQDVISLKIPHSFAENYFELRSNIDFVRDKLGRCET